MIHGSDQRGDTLIEVTVALAILSMVLMGSAAVATTAFRMGQTARERTTLVEAAQEQMEALHSFRDNHTWAEFQGGNGCGTGGFCGIDQASSSPAAPCKMVTGKDCFYMEQWPAVNPTGWVPVSGTITTSSPSNTTKLTVPTSMVEITLADETLTNPGSKACGYDFELHYAFDPLGETQPADNEIKTRLVNLSYTPPSAGANCPS